MELIEQSRIRWTARPQTAVRRRPRICRRKREARQAALKLVLALAWSAAAAWAVGEPARPEVPSQVSAAAVVQF